MPTDVLLKKLETGNGQYSAIETNVESRRCSAHQGNIALIVLIAANR